MKYFYTSVDTEVDVTIDAESIIMWTRENLSPEEVFYDEDFISLEKIIEYIQNERDLKVLQKIKEECDYILNHYKK